MADIEQWVNLTNEDKWKGDGLSSKDQMGRFAKIRIKFTEKSPAIAWVSKKADGDNAKYDGKKIEKNKLEYKVTDYKRRQVLTNENGEVDLTLKVSLAGGDIFEIKIEDKNGKTIQADNLLTRRKLYFQVIKMAGVSALSEGDITDLQDEYWNAAKKTFIKMIEIQNGKTILSMRNLDHSNAAALNSIFKRTWQEYDASKVPYCFAVLVIRRNGKSKWEEDSKLATFDTTNSHYFETESVLFDIVDPSVKFFEHVYWFPKNYPGFVNIPEDRISRSGDFGVEIDTTGYPKGEGRLVHKLRVLASNGMGLSFTNLNFTVVATEDAVTGDPLQTEDILATIIHEIGHKIGMVPGPQGTLLLDKQNTYYDKWHVGGHCFHGIDKGTVELPANFTIKSDIRPDCTMYGTERSHTIHFCEDCSKSLRKLDLRASKNVGLSNQFGPR